MEKYSIREKPLNPKTPTDVGILHMEFKGPDAWEQAVKWVSQQPQPKTFAIHRE